MSKIKIEHYSFNLLDNGYEVDCWQDGEDHSCFVSLDDIKEFRCESNGIVNASIFSPYTQEIVAEKYISFEEYMDDDFPGEAEILLALIIDKKEILCF